MVLCENVQGEDNLLIRARVAALLQLLTQLIKCKNDPAAIVGFIEVAGMLVDGELTQSMLDEFFVCACIEIPMHAVKIFNAAQDTRCGEKLYQGTESRPHDAQETVP